VDLHCVLDQFEISCPDFWMPIEKTGFIDEVFDNKVVQAIGIWQDFGNLLKGGKRGFDHVEQYKVEFAGAAQVEKPHVREGLERVSSEPHARRRRRL
jgi:hypothetical protein